MIIAGMGRFEPLNKDEMREALCAIADIDLKEINYDDEVVLRLTIKFCVALVRRALKWYDDD
jgi:hypothetical protein